MGEGIDFTIRFLQSFGGLVCEHPVVSRVSDNALGGDTSMELPGIVDFMESGESFGVLLLLKMRGPDDENRVALGTINGGCGACGLVTDEVHDEDDQSNTGTIGVAAPPPPAGGDDGGGARIPSKNNFKKRAFFSFPGRACNISQTINALSKLVTTNRIESRACDS